MIEFIVSGALGGGAAEFMKWYKHRETLVTNPPVYLKSRSYWVLTLAMIGVSGVLPFIYVINGAELNIVIAFNLGVSAPLVLSGAVNLVETPSARIG